MAKYRILYSTHPSLAQARRAARLLLGKKLVACCNIFPAIESHYRWKGKLTKNTEVAMISKTTKGNAEAAMKQLAASHPYDTPAVLELPVAAGHKAFLRWISKECRG